MSQAATQLEELGQPAVQAAAYTSRQIEKRGCCKNATVSLLSVGGRRLVYPPREEPRLMYHSGRRLGDFVLREQIGEGGCAVVYRCEQP